eukprot:8993240-Ditylum_brightwellii.AAC.1
MWHHAIGKESSSHARNTTIYTWKGKSEILTPVTKLCSKNQPQEWTETERKTFEDAKKTVAKNALLIYPDFNKPVEIHTDKSQYQLGATISQGSIPIEFFFKEIDFNTTELHHNRERVAGYSRATKRI